MYATSYIPEDKIWKGKELPSLYDFASPVGRVVLHALDLTPTKVAQVRKEPAYLSFKAILN